RSGLAQRNRDCLRIERATQDGRARPGPLEAERHADVERASLSERARVDQYGVAGCRRVDRVVDRGVAHRGELPAAVDLDVAHTRGEGGTRREGEDRDDEAEGQHGDEDATSKMQALTHAILLI